MLGLIALIFSLEATNRFNLDLPESQVLTKCLYELSSARPFLRFCSHLHNSNRIAFDYMPLDLFLKPFSNSALELVSSRGGILRLAYVRNSKYELLKS